MAGASRFGVEIERRITAVADEVDSIGEEMCALYIDISRAAERDLPLPAEPILELGTDLQKQASLLWVLFCHEPSGLVPDEIVMVRRWSEEGPRKVAQLRRVWSPRTGSYEFVGLPPALRFVAAEVERLSTRSSRGRIHLEWEQSMEWFADLWPDYEPPHDA